jgi:hypothetical protein
MRMEHGDWKGADRLRRQAEVLSLRTQTPTMFHSLLALEAALCYRANDLDGLRHVIERMRRIAEVHAGWVFNLITAEGYFDLARGDHEAAQLNFERCIELSRFDASGLSVSTTMWVASQTGLAEALIAQERFVEARVSAAAAHRACEERGIAGYALDLARVLALAEAKSGAARSSERLDALIEQQAQHGVTGLRIGLCYETRARIAIAQQDAAAFEQFSRLTARAYRHGTDNALGVRYERLMNEAARQGMVGTVALLGDYAAGGRTDSSASELQQLVGRSMGRTQRAEERSHAALELICDARRSRGGHLYLQRRSGATLTASLGEAHASLQLTEAAHQLLAEESARSDVHTSDIATAALQDDEPGIARRELGGVTYELLVLRSLLQGARQIAGVAAVVAGAEPRIDARQLQLLEIVATHLLQSGDVGA